ncbi:hypothetical protein [Aurantiacibacter marinus]|uniref:Uncharacterized protein n=1 Tax=Aurantiacibacter marinus TaxID=874156 RepID=A0A0H0XQ58_9SPHN|nr:hypothetical protein [Aurantiacibacter marinus]KLI64464.1 hypothetical protein AAV99_02375 [Aurantiacibacter marinus]
MHNSTVLKFGGAAVLAIAAILASAPAAAQAAAEEAVILNSTGQGTGAAARDMGNAVRGSIGGASDAIAATRSRSSRARRGGSSTPGSSSGGTPSRSASSYTVYWITSDVDALDKFAVPTYRMNNGAILRMSGTLIATRDAICLSTCPAY